MKQSLVQRVMPSAPGRIGISVGRQKSSGASEGDGLTATACISVCQVHSLDPASYPSLWLDLTADLEGIATQQ